MKLAVIDGEHGEFRVMLPMYRIRHVAVTVRDGVRVTSTLPNCPRFLDWSRGLFCFWGGPIVEWRSRRL